MYRRKRSTRLVSSLYLSTYNNNSKNIIYNHFLLKHIDVNDMDC